MKEEEKGKVYWNWVRFIVNKLKEGESEMREAFSHNKPFYIASKPLSTCSGFKVKKDALDFAKDVFCNAGYLPCDYNFDIIKWDAKECGFIVGVTKKGKKINMERKGENNMNMERKGENNMNMERKGENNMNTKDAILTRNVTIVVQLEEYDFREPESFRVTVNTGTEIKEFHLYAEDIARQRAWDTNKFRIEYESKDLFDFEDLKITCKYPVKVYCTDFRCSLLKKGER